MSILIADEVHYIFICYFFLPVKASDKLNVNEVLKFSTQTFFYKCHWINNHQQHSNLFLTQSGIRICSESRHIKSKNIRWQLEWVRPHRIRQIWHRTLRLRSIWIIWEQIKYSPPNVPFNSNLPKAGHEYLLVWLKCMPPKIFRHSSTVTSDISRSPQVKLVNHMFYIKNVYSVLLIYWVEEWSPRCQTSLVASPAR